MQKVIPKYKIKYKNIGNYIIKIVLAYLNVYYNIYCYITGSGFGFRNIDSGVVDIVGLLLHSLKPEGHITGKIIRLYLFGFAGCARKHKFITYDNLLYTYLKKY